MRNLATRLLLLLIVIVVPASAGASGELLGAPRYDHATETTYRLVEWDDFKGKGARPPDWNRWKRGSFAHIATTIRIGSFEVVDRQQDGQWIAEAAGIRPYAIMNKDLSAVKHGSRNAYTLAHEQLHFDVAETVARRLAVELARLEGHGSSADEAREDLDRRLRERFEAGLRELGELQNRYDGEIAGKVVGVVGYGQVARRMAVILEAIGAKELINARDRFNPETGSFATKADLLEHSDIVSLHIPETAETRGWLDAEAIDQMKPGAIVIN